LQLDGSIYAVGESRQFKMLKSGYSHLILHASGTP
jgi:hypothetical protein